MKVVHFLQWLEVLNSQHLPKRLQQTFEITIRWYLRRFGVPLRNLGGA